MFDWTDLRSLGFRDLDIHFIAYILFVALETARLFVSCEAQTRPVHRKVGPTKVLKKSFNVHKGYNI